MLGQQRMLALTHKMLLLLYQEHTHTHNHTHLPPSLYANHASEHEQATESPERQRGWPPPSLLHFLLHRLLSATPPFTFPPKIRESAPAHHLPATPTKPHVIPPHQNLSFTRPPHWGVSGLAEAVAMETGPICTLSPWHPPL